MDLNEQVGLIREHWRLLLEVADDRVIPQHTLLNVVAAELAKVLAEQPAHVVREWLVELDDHIERLRSRSREQLDP